MSDMEYNTGTVVARVTQPVRFQSDVAGSLKVIPAVAGSAISTTNPLPVSVVSDPFGEYETVAASQTNQSLGATGALGDKLSRLLVVPATTSPGAITIKDGGDAAITVFTGGAASITTLTPFSIPLDLISRTGAWQITTGASVSVIASGNFT